MCYNPSEGDPCPHDHVLVANLVEMLDERGGWKAATTALWREHLPAATMLGRVAAARGRGLAGAGMEIRFGLEPLDDHDRILADRQRHRSPAEAEAVERRHRRNVDLFAGDTARG